MGFSAQVEQFIFDAPVVWGQGSNSAGMTHPQPGIGIMMGGNAPAGRLDSQRIDPVEIEKASGAGELVKAVDGDSIVVQGRGQGIVPGRRSIVLEGTGVEGDVSWWLL